MRIDVVTIFTGMFDAITQFGITRRAQDSGLLELHLWDPRGYTDDPHRSVDDRPYGGGPGMVMRPEPLAAALDQARAAHRGEVRTIYLSPQGRPMDHRAICRMAQGPGLVMLAGRYEGVDERLLQSRIDEEWSIGDYVLSGGELAAMVLIDAIVRQLPGALGNASSAEQDSFVNGVLDCPHYTRPERFEGRDVPDVLMSGNHDGVRRWRLKQALGRTWLRRPDLLDRCDLDTEQSQLLHEFKQEYQKQET